MPLVDSLPAGWSAALEVVENQPEWRQLRVFLENLDDVLPARSQWFNALACTPLDRVKVVILGQDPYPTPGHAHGLSFSVEPNVRRYPKSLLNIFKELQNDVGVVAETGCLQSWADQGVLLLNTVLTVSPGKAGSHRSKGWELLTDEIIGLVNRSAASSVFILWGNHAQKKKPLIDGCRHLIIESPHPSPLSSYRGFFGSQPFSRSNAFLVEKGRPPVDWSLPSQDLFGGPV